MTKGEVGVWNCPKKDDVIYEQPLRIKKSYDIKYDLLVKKYVYNKTLVESVQFWKNMHSDLV